MADCPFVRILPWNGPGYQFVRDRTLGSELGDIFLRLRAVSVNRERRHSMPRYATARAVLSLRSADGSASAQRIEIGDRFDSKTVLNYQFELTGLATEVQDILRELIADCRHQFHGMIDYLQGLMQWLDIDRENV